MNPESGAMISIWTVRQARPDTMASEDLTVMETV
jgi:hypothetical protein